MASPLGALGFVGREREIGEMRRVLASVAEGRPAVCLLVGEPGIGKSRTAAEVMHLARGRGFAVASATCSESGPP